MHGIFKILFVIAWDFEIFICDKQIKNELKWLKVSIALNFHD